jgi:hypothetical protein
LAAGFVGSVLAPTTVITVSENALDGGVGVGHHFDPNADAQQPRLSRGYWT